MGVYAYPSYNLVYQEAPTTCVVSVTKLIVSKFGENRQDVTRTPTTPPSPFGGQLFWVRGGISCISEGFSLFGVPRLLK